MRHQTTASQLNHGDVHYTPNENGMVDIAREHLDLFQVLIDCGTLMPAPEPAGDQLVADPAAQPGGDPVLTVSIPSMWDPDAANPDGVITTTSTPGEYVTVKADQPRKRGKRSG